MLKIIKVFLALIMSAFLLFCFVSCNNSTPSEPQSTVIGTFNYPQIEIPQDTDFIGDGLHERERRYLWEKENEGLGRLQLAIKEDRAKDAYEDIKADIEEYIKMRNDLYNRYNERISRVNNGEYLKDNFVEHCAGFINTINELDTFKSDIQELAVANKAGLDYLYEGFGTNLTNDLFLLADNIAMIQSSFTDEGAYWAQFTDENDFNNKMTKNEKVLKYEYTVTLQSDISSNTASEESEPMVWISKNGTKYHYDKNCGDITGALQVTKSAAERDGYELCPKCYLHNLS